MAVLTIALAALGIGGPTTDHCSGACERRVQKRVVREHKQGVVRPVRGWLERVARCESGGDWSTNTGNGFYGGLQFTLSSYRAVGGKGMPHTASKLDQMYAGAKLLRIQGPSAWPVCSHRA